MSNTLAINLRCVKCKYNLRGMDRQGRCPECGESVSNSRRDKRLKRWKRRRHKRSIKLEAASKRWLKGQLEATTLMAIAAMMVAIYSLTPESWFDRYTTTRTALFVYVCISFGLSTMGAWKLASKTRRQSAWIGPVARV
jgi:hypothetical protein